MRKDYLPQPINEWEAIHSLLLAVFKYQNTLKGMERDYRAIQFVRSL